MNSATWYPVALSAMIEAGTSAGAVLGGAELAVWRDTSGTAHVWEDRCPHRGMKLSFGFVRGDHIACLYHGWEYDAEGQCRYIPAHPKLEVPKSICVRRHGVAEAGGMIWARLDGPAEAPDAPAATGLRSLYIDADEAALRAHLPVLGLTGLTETGPLWQGVTEFGPLLIGVQPVAAGRIALHLAHPGALEADARAALLRRAVALRSACEAGRVAA